MLSHPPKDRPGGGLQFHASSVAVDGKAVLIAGPSGCGKSSLAIGMMALGASLIADDITWVDHEDGTLMASCPPTILNKIEARGLGVLRADASGPAPVRAILDLAQVEDQRIPSPRSVSILGHDVPLLHRPATDHVAAMMMHYMRFGRID
ncbi:MAG: serine/threonine protein kinase [Pseudomonadota bacterium]